MLGTMNLFPEYEQLVIFFCFKFTKTTQVGIHIHTLKIAKKKVKKIFISEKNTVK